MPTETPMNFTLVVVSHTALALSWQDIPILSTHGIMRNFTLSCKAILANQSLHQRDDVVDYVAQQGVAQHSYIMNNLYPYTVYNCTVHGCTTPGCGPNAKRSNETLQWCKYLFWLFLFKIRICYFVIQYYIFYQIFRCVTEYLYKRAIYLLVHPHLKSRFSRKYLNRITCVSCSRWTTILQPRLVSR